MNNQLTTCHSDNQVAKINPNDISMTIKGIVPRSFEKTFLGVDTKQIEYAFELCTKGLTRQQIVTGMNEVANNGFCPDPAMFRKWCLGIKGFSSDINPVKDSYKGKFAAIANIESWMGDSSTLITNAEREAYNRTYGMFNQIQWSSNHEKAKYYAYEAFKDAYVEVVKEFISKDIYQEIWDSKLALENKTPIKAKSVEKSYLNDLSAEEKEKLDSDTRKVRELVSSGKSLMEAAEIVKNQRSDK